MQTDKRYHKGQVLVECLVLSALLVALLLIFDSLIHLQKVRREEKGFFIQLDLPNELSK